MDNENEQNNSPEEKPEQSQPAPQDQPAPEGQPTPVPADNTPEPPQPKPEPPAEQPPSPERLAKAEQIVKEPITRLPQKTDSEISRRTFIQWLIVGWGAFAAIVAGYGTLVMRYLFPNVLFEPKQSFRAGYPNEYPVDQVSERWKAQHGVWIVRTNEILYALSTTCTHLGCTPNWLENDNKFKCPCHGSGFYKSGINFEGPAPRPLERFKVYLADDGEIIVDKTAKFQQEKGEWNDPDSFIVV